MKIYETKLLPIDTHEVEELLNRKGKAGWSFHSVVQGHRDLLVVFEKEESVKIKAKRQHHVDGVG